MTKRERFVKNLKKIIVEEEWTDSGLSLLANIALSCDECPVSDADCSTMGGNCDDKILKWLQEHGDEAVAGKND